MAHADYNCCAWCDRKMAYASPDATTKEDLCTSCMKGLHSRGVMVYDGAELAAWIRSDEGGMTPGEKLSILRSRFNKCYYRNPVDEAYEWLEQQDGTQAEGGPA